MKRVVSLMLIVVHCAPATGLQNLAHAKGLDF
jgi:hypothetical protein